MPRPDLGRHLLRAGQTQKSPDSRGFFMLQSNQAGCTFGVVVVVVPPQPPVPDELPLEEPPPHLPLLLLPPLQGFFGAEAFLEPQPVPPETNSISLSVKTRISISC